MLEFEPVVDDVAHQEELVAVVLDGFEETNDPTLVFLRVFQSAGAQMAIADEIDLSH